MRTQLLPSTMASETVLLHYVRRSKPTTEANRTKRIFHAAGGVHSVLVCIYWVLFNHILLYHQMIAYLIRCRTSNVSLNKLSVLFMMLGDFALIFLIALDGLSSFHTLNLETGFWAPPLLWALILLSDCCQWTCLFMLWRQDANREVTGTCECRVVEAEGQCPICLEDHDSSSVSIERCSHVFHQSCLQKWVEINPTCPVCRTNVENPPSFSIDVND